MNKVKKTFKIIGILIGSLLLACIIVFGILYLIAPEQPEPKIPIGTVEELDNYFQEITEKQLPPSLSVAVYKQGEKVYEKAFGYADYPEKIKAETSTIYRWWSVTKLFTAVAVMQLVEEGAIDLEDTVEKYLPYFPVYSKEGVKKDVTIRQLLMHEAGLKSMVPDMFKWVHLEGEETPGVTEFFKEKIVTDYQELSYEPGSESKYTNTAYIVLGAIIEEVTGVKYEDYVTEKILKPLELEGSSFVRNEEQANRTARGSNPVININIPLMFIYGPDNFFKDYVVYNTKGHLWFRYVYTDFTPSTALIGTAEELARFGKMFLDKGTYKSKKILEVESVTLILADYNLEEIDKEYSEDIKKSIGFKVWNLNNSLAYGHGGGGIGYGAIFAILPERELVLSVLANDTTFNRNACIEALASINW
jgi:CubicO group peptidase (beta-lactamase class C family)